MLTWCIKSFKSSYALGNYQETVTDTFLNTTGRRQQYPWEVFPIHVQGEDVFFTIFHGNISLHPPWTNPSGSEYGISNETYTRTQALFDDMFPSFITAANSTAPAWWRIRAYAWGLNQLRPITTSPWLAPNNVTQYVERLATSLTNVFRSHKSHEFVRGQAYAQYTFIAVHLEWLIFPLVLLVLCLVFLVATIWKTSKERNGDLGVWKTSAMPTLIYSLPKDTQNKFVSPSAWKSGSDRRSKKIKIRLHPKQGWRVSGQPCRSPALAMRNEHPAPPGWI